MPEPWSSQTSHNLPAPTTRVWCLLGGLKWAVIVPDQSDADNLNILLLPLIELKKLFHFQVQQMISSLILKILRLLEYNDLFHLLGYSETSKYLAQ